jgi:hypothetical protein
MEHQKNPEEINWIDDAFKVEKARWGTWKSTEKDGTGVITSLTEEDCIRATRWYLKKRQEGWGDECSVHEGSVEYKL